MEKKGLNLKFKTLNFFLYAGRSDPENLNKIILNEAKRHR